MHTSRRDQNDTAVRVVCRGAGVRISPKAKPAAIRAAVERVLREPSFRDGARTQQPEVRKTHKKNIHHRDTEAQR